MIIIICTTLIRENTPGVFVENAFRRQQLYCWFSLLSHIQLTVSVDDDDDDSNWKMQGKFSTTGGKKRAKEREMLNM